MSIRPSADSFRNTAYTLDILLFLFTIARPGSLKNPGPERIDVGLRDLRTRRGCSSNSGDYGHNHRNGAARGTASLTFSYQTPHFACFARLAQRHQYPGLHARRRAYQHSLPPRILAPCLPHSLPTMHDQFPIQLSQWHHHSRSTNHRQIDSSSAGSVSMAFIRLRSYLRRHAPPSRIHR